MGLKNPAFFETQWYRPSLTFLTFCLLPFSWLFRAVVYLRRLLYRLNIKKSFGFSVPVIVVGNITVGGTGKTPVVIWLANYLRANGYTPGIVSRGVGGEPQLEPYWINAYSGAREVGDEAIVLAKRTQCPFVICIDRVAAVKELLSKTPCDIVISDDGLQHYRLARSLEIAIIDGSRGFGNQQLLPAGPLREPVSRLKSVDIVLTNTPSVKTSFVTSKQNVFSFTLQATTLVSLKDEFRKVPIAEFENKRVHAVAAIGNPGRFFSMLREKGFDVIEHAFPDHYFFKAEDFIFEEDLPVIMTEKDAVKCHGIVDERFWFIPVDLVMEEKFLSAFVMPAKAGI